MEKPIIPHKGKEIYFDSTGFDRTVGFYKSQVPKINLLAQQYEQHSGAKFSKETFLDLVTKKGKDFQKQYHDRIAEQIKNLGITSPSIQENLRKQALADLKAYLGSVHDYETEFEQYSTTEMYGILPLSFDRIEILDGRAIVTDAMIASFHNHFATTIETEDQSELYSLFLQMKPLHDRMSEILTKHNSKIDVIGETNDPYVLLYSDQDKKLQFVGESIATVN